MKPEFLEKYYLSESDEETFLRFYKKSLYYEDMGGYLRRVPDKVFQAILRKWDILPDELKERATLPAIAKYKSDEEYTEYGAYEPKEFGMAQINYNREYFPSVEDYQKTCEELRNLPNDKKTVYDYLHSHSMFNLNYVPNKIRLLDDYVSDKLNISFKEKTQWLEDKNLKYEDLVGFGDANRNFSHNNYLKSVDLLMSVVANDAEGAFHFRKMYQYYNLMEAVQYSDYNTYNWKHNQYDDYDDDDDDNYASSYDDSDETENLDAEIDDLIAEREMMRTSEDYVSYMDKKHNFTLEAPRDSMETPLVALYLQNQEEVSKVAYGLCRVLGKQSEAFVRHFLEIEDKSAEKTISYYPTDKEDYQQQDEISPIQQFEDDFEFFTEQEFAIKNRINAAKLKKWSFLAKQKSPEQRIFEADSPEKYADYVYNKKELCSPEAQKKLLELLSVFPTDFDEEKYISFGNFIKKNFFYKTHTGKVCTRPTEEIEKIVNVWPQLNKTQETMKYSDILNLAKSGGYLNSRKEEFVAEAKLRGLPKKMFDIAQSAYIRGLDTPRTITKNHSVQSGDFTLRLMDVKDPSVMFIGEGFSCQTIKKAGIYPALSSVQDPFSRALVVEKGEHAVGLAWVWTTEEEKYGKKYKSMCIDNLELADFTCYGPDLPQIMSGLTQLSIKIADEENFRRVTLGAKATHYMPENYFPTTDSLNLPQTYLEQTPLDNIKEKINYGDSARQVLVYENPLAKPLGKDLEVFVAHRDIYTITEDEENGALAVGDKAYPWKAEFREKDKDSQFMILKDKQNRVLGYALYSDMAHHVHDVAVAPEYQAYSKYMLFELLNHMKENSDKPWEAECRKSTSLALLDKMAERGSIRLNKLDGVIGIMGERLQKVSIDFNVGTSQAKTLAQKDTKER